MDETVLIVPYYDYDFCFDDVEIHFDCDSYPSKKEFIHTCYRVWIDRMAYHNMQLL